MLTKYYSFQSQNQQGKVGESFFKRLLYDIPGVVETVDLSNNRLFRELDIDLIVWYETAKIYWEIKTDTQGYRTGNLFFETVSDGNIGSIGCMKKTQADFVLYLYCEGQSNSVALQWKAAIIDIHTLREWVTVRRFPLKSVPNKNYYAYGYIIPRKTLLKELPDAYMECSLSDLGVKVSQMMFQWLYKSA